MTSPASPRPEDESLATEHLGVRIEPMAQLAAQALALDGVVKPRDTLQSCIACTAHVTGQI
ncbi:hypothetical protein [Pseudomonas sp. SIMBA_067]|uniref:hypothetical protein n=1 Tax=Pseudomonas sp. SIMBA_067 TaxID=3085807 RepID=UPI00397C2BFF